MVLEKDLKEADNFKVIGNDKYSKGEIREAISAYSEGLSRCKSLQKEDIIHAVLHLNLAMCYLYLLSKRKSPLENDDENAQTAVTHCEHAIDILNKLENTENNKKYREKALYRRAMAYHHICQESSAAPDRKNEVLNLAAQDLLDVLNINSKNSAAAKLLSSIRKLHSQNKSMGPLQKCLDVFKGYLRGDAEHTSDEVKGALRTIITGEFLDDFGRSGGRDIILEFLRNISDGDDELQKLALHIILNFSEKNIPINSIRSYCNTLLSLKVSSTNAPILFAIFSNLVKQGAPDIEFITIKFDEKVAAGDTLMKIDSIEYLESDDVVPHNNLADLINNLTELDDYVLEFINVWITKNEVSSNVDKNSLRPKEFAKVNKVEYLLGEYQKVRLNFIAKLVSLEKLVKFESSDVIITKLLQRITDEEKVGAKTISNISKSHINLARFASCVFLADEQLGIKLFHKLGIDDLSNLIRSKDEKAQAVASQLIYTASNFAAGRTKLSLLLQKNVGSNDIEFLDDDETKVNNLPPIQILLQHKDPQIKSNAALALAKLDLGSKNHANLDEFFETALELLEQGNLAGVELLNYLCVKPTYKNLICGDDHLLDLLADIDILKEVDPDAISEEPKSSVEYAYVNIVHNLSVSVKTLERESFADKEMDYESYLQLKKMNSLKVAEGKSVDEDDDFDQEAELYDDAVSVSKRVMKIANKIIPAKILAILEKQTTTLVQDTGSMALLRIASEPKARGRLIQCGVLNKCVNLASESSKLKDHGPAHDKLSTAHHIIAKLLITINPNILSSTQKLGAIPHLVSILRDSSPSSTLLPIYESLLSLTNLASDDSCKDKVGKSLGKINYHVFSDNMKVRCAAVECISNLACTKYVFSYFTGINVDDSGKMGPSTATAGSENDHKQNLMLFCALALDVDEFEISRAALGCLAMCTSAFSEVRIEMSKLDSFAEFINLSAYSNLELMHRALVILSNMLEEESLRDNVDLIKQVNFCVGYAAHFGSLVNAGEYEGEDLDMLQVTLGLAQEIAGKYDS